MKVGDIVKLKNPKNKREAKRRWLVLPWGDESPIYIIRLRRLDTATRRLEVRHEAELTPISIFEKIFKRY